MSVGENNISPEERLFRIIKDPGGASAGPGEHKEKRGLFDLSAVKNILARFGQKIAPAGAAGYKMAFPAQALHFHEINIRTVNKILVVIAAILAMCEIYHVVFGRPDITKITRALSDVRLEEAARAQKVEAFKPVSYYLDQVRKKGIFFAKPSAEKGVLSFKAGEPVSRLKDAVKDLKLKGIAWGKSPKAIIKNEKEDKTYFLNEEQMIGSTGIEVKTILKRKIVISCGDEEMELQ